MLDSERYREPCVQAAPRHTQAHYDAASGVLRCLASMADWEQLLRTCRDEWAQADSLRRQEMSTVAGHAAWHVGDWKSLARFVSAMDVAGREPQTSTASLLRAVLAIQQGQAMQTYEAAELHLARARCAAAPSTRRRRSTCLDGGFRELHGPAESGGLLGCSAAGIFAGSPSHNHRPFIPLCAMRCVPSAAAHPLPPSPSSRQYGTMSVGSYSRPSLSRSSARATSARTRTWCAHSSAPS